MDVPTWKALDPRLQEWLWPLALSIMSASIFANLAMLFRIGFRLFSKKPSTTIIVPLLLISNLAFVDFLFASLTLPLIAKSQSTGYLFGGISDEISERMRRISLCRFQASSFFTLGMVQCMSCSLIAFFTMRLIAGGMNHNRDGALWSLKGAVMRIFCVWLLPVPIAIALVFIGNEQPVARNAFCVYDMSLPLPASVVFAFCGSAFIFIACCYLRTFFHCRATFARVRAHKAKAHSRTRGHQSMQIEEMLSLVHVAKKLSVYVFVFTLGWTAAIISAISSLYLDTASASFPTEAAMAFCVLTQGMLNPFVYCLQNKHVCAHLHAPKVSLLRQNVSFGNDALLKHNNGLAQNV